MIDTYFYRKDLTPFDLIEWLAHKLSKIEIINLTGNVEFKSWFQSLSCEASEYCNALIAKANVKMMRINATNALKCVVLVMKSLLSLLIKSLCQ